VECGRLLARCQRWPARSLERRRQPHPGQKQRDPGEEELRAGPADLADQSAPRHDPVLGIGQEQERDQQDRSRDLGKPGAQEHEEGDQQDGEIVMPAIGSDDAGGQETQGQHVVQRPRSVQGSPQHGREQGYRDQRIKRPEAPGSEPGRLQQQERRRSPV